jgi:hypothetical protein
MPQENLVRKHVPESPDLILGSSANVVLSQIRKPGPFRLPPRRFILLQAAGFVTCLGSAIVVGTGLTGGYITWLSLIVGLLGAFLSRAFWNVHGIWGTAVLGIGQAVSATIVGSIFPIIAALAEDKGSRPLVVVLIGLLLFLMFGGIRITML